MTKLLLKVVAKYFTLHYNRNMRVYTSVYDREESSDKNILVAIRHYFGDGIGFCRINGKPQLISDKSVNDSMYISVSHTDTYIAVAVSDKPVGIDTEMINERRNYRAIAKKMNWNADISPIAFYKKWTEYEARFKANICETATVRYYDIFKGAITALVSETDELAEFYPLEQIMTI